MKNAALAMFLVAGCAATATLPQIDPGLDALATTEVHPSLLLPSTSLDVLGAGFVDSDAGLSFVLLHGSFTPDGAGARDVDLALPAMFLDDTHVTVGPDAGPWTAFGMVAGTFDG